MSLDEISSRGIVLLGCGRMGSALLKGWLARGVPARGIAVIEPEPSAWLRETGVSISGGLPPTPAVLLVAVKPQLMSEALAPVTGVAGGETLVVSIAAGTPISAFEAAFGTETPIVRAMPNTPAAIGHGITAITGNAATGPAHLAEAEALLEAVGQVVRVDREDLMDVVTAVSGSGPAYVFHLIEALAAAGEAQGMPPDLALRLARVTVAGAGALAEASAEPPGTLRENVTSPGGTTAAALEVLMDETRGFPGLLKDAVAAATKRGRELGA
ncbi:MAG: pyrroline-5-carboxylate reductase [Pseudomonadota bacterium]